MSKAHEENMMWKLRSEADSAALLIDVKRKEEARTKIGEELEKLHAEYYNARTVYWNAKLNRRIHVKSTIVHMYIYVYIICIYVYMYI